LDILIGHLKNVEIVKSKDDKNVTIHLSEMDGNFYGSKSEIKIPAKSYEVLEKEIVEKWLEKKKDQV